MNKKLTLAVGLFIMLAASTVTAKITTKNPSEIKIPLRKNSWEKSREFTSYVGIDTEWRHLDFQKGFGNNLFKHNYPQGNAYLGVKSKYIGIEAGYEATVRKTRTSTVVSGDTSAGILVPPQVTIRYNSTTQIKGHYVNLVVFVPIYEKYQLQLIGIIGTARLKTNFIRNAINLNGNPINRTTIFIQRKSVLRLGGGIQHMFAENWGIRVMLKWENMNKFNKIRDPKDNLSSIANKSNSLIYSFGTFVTF